MGVGEGGEHWTSCWILSLPPCARPASQFISQPPLSSAVLSQASQQVSLCRRVLPLHTLTAASLCSNSGWQADTSTPQLKTSICSGFWRKFPEIFLSNSIKIAPFVITNWYFNTKKVLPSTFCLRCKLMSYSTVSTGQSLYRNPPPESH